MVTAIRGCSLLYALALLNGCVAQPVRNGGSDALVVLPASDQAAPSLPTSSDRQIATGDLLEVSVFGAPELSRTARVADDGSIALPLLGLIRAAGRTPRQLEAALADTLRATFMRDPRVTVDVKEAALRPVYVLGEVNQPGAFTQTGESRLTILRAVAMARGLKPNAAGSRVLILRPRPGADPLQIAVNLGDVVDGRAADVTLQANDVVYIPTSTERAVTLGMLDAMMRIVTVRAVF